MDVVTLGLAKADAVRRFLGKIARPGSLPSGLGWDTATYPITYSLYDVPGQGRQVGTCSLTAASAFDAVSTARSAPGATYYVDVLNGNDTTGTGTSGAPYRSIGKAQSSANAGGVPTKIIVLNTGTYYRGNNPTFNSGAGGVFPTVDTAILASGGRIHTGTFDSFTAPSLDATNTNCYTIAVTAATVDRVVDIANLNRLGNYTELVKVVDAATCNITPNSWAHVAGTVYINRADRAAVTTTNTRYYRSASSTFKVTATNVNLFIGGVSGNDGFDCEGGTANGVLEAGGALATGSKVLAVANCTFKYGGGAINNAAGRGVSVDSWSGLAIFENCRADANLTDGFNFHNSQGSTKPLVLTVNCSAADNGRLGQASCNGWTAHENVIGIDVAGYYQDNHGGTARNINTTRALLAGTTIVNDQGDRSLNGGGGMEPTAIRIDDTGELWCDRVHIQMPAGTYAYSTGGGGSKIHKRDCWPAPQPDSGPGVIDTY